MFPSQNLGEEVFNLQLYTTFPHNVKLLMSEQLFKLLSSHSKKILCNSYRMYKLNWKNTLLSVDHSPIHVSIDNRGKSGVGVDSLRSGVY